MLEVFQNLFAPPRHMILLVIAAWLGITLAEKRTERYGISKEDLNNIAFNSLLVFIIGGRLSFVLQNISAFTKSPLGIISINPDLFDPIGGLAAAIIAALIYGQRKQLEFWNTLDALTPIFAVIAIGMGLSHLAAGTAFGKPTDLPWGIELWNAARHPTQIYQILASFLTLGILWFLKPFSRSGLFFLLFAAFTSAWQVFLQAFRGDSAMIKNGIKQEQIIALVLLAIACVLIETRLQKSRTVL